MTTQEEETPERVRAQRDQYLAALRRIKARRTEPRTLELLGVRRFGEFGETTPVVIGGRDACGDGRPSDHIRLGCIALSYTDRAGQYGVIHITSADARRLADLLHAMADEDSPPG
ncbi:hypothetical protein ACWC09_26420 [Streptomyces sp. NPDC001617]